MNTKSEAPSNPLVAQLHDELYSGLFTMEQTRRVLGVSQPTLTKMIRAHDLRTVKLGTITYVSQDSLKAFIANAVGTTNGHCSPPSPRDELTP